jgi:hypothetical protein
VLVRIDSIEDLGGFGAGDGTVAAGGIATVRGWAVDAASREPVGTLRIAIGDAPPVNAISGFARDDIAQRLASDSARGCGFVAAVPVDAPLGPQPVRIEANIGGEWITADARWVEVVPQPDPFEELPERAAGWLFNVDRVELSDGSRVPYDGERWIVPPGAVGRMCMWALDVPAGRPPSKVVALAGGTFFAAVPGFETGHVAAATGLPAERAGFTLAVMPPFVGGETLRLFAIAADAGCYGQLGTVRTSLAEPLPLDALPRRGKALGAIDRIEVDGVRADPSEPIRLEPGARLRLEGWAVDRSGPRLAASVELDVPGAGRFEAEYGFRRQDVALALGAPVAACGFTLVVDSGAFSPGRYRATPRVLAARRDAFTVLPDVELVIG